MPDKSLQGLASRLKSIADIGLLYNPTGYDKERYAEIREISFDLLAAVTGKEINLLKESYADTREYPTVKVDIRAFITRGREILLVKELTDNKWSLPGGWADIGYSPKEVVIKECREETGLDVSVERLLAVFDKRMHPHPPQPFYVYKMVFHCIPVETVATKGFDIGDVQYFDIDQLPDLSTDRICESQLLKVFNQYKLTETATYFD